jgi:hypothetical protein
VQRLRLTAGVGAHNHTAMDIRSFRDSDEAAVIQLWDRCGLLRPWNDPRKDIARKKRMQRDLFLVGTVDGEIVAASMSQIPQKSCRRI